MTHNVKMTVFYHLTIMLLSFGQCNGSIDLFCVVITITTYLKKIAIKGYRMGLKESQKSNQYFSYSKYFNEIALNTVVYILSDGAMV